MILCFAVFESVRSCLSLFRHWSRRKIKKKFPSREYYDLLDAHVLSGGKSLGGEVADFRNSLDVCCTIIRAFDNGTSGLSCRTDRCSSLLANKIVILPVLTFSRSTNT